MYNINIQRILEKMCYTSNMNKVCKRCNTDQSIDNFGPHKKTKDRRSTHCRPCDSKRQVEYQKKHPEKYKTSWIKRGIERHGITEEKYEELLNSNNSKCWLCNGESNGNKRLAIDHDHSCCEKAYSCGKCIRGLLCMSCNTMVGSIEKGQVTLSNIESYLRH